VFNGALGAALSGGGYLRETLALFARFSTVPTDTRAKLINQTIRSLKAAGIWPLLDGLYFTAAADSQAATRNWIADQYNLSGVNSPAFVADRGYTGDQSTSYLDTGFNPTTAIAPKFTQDNVTLALYQRVATGGSNRPVMGNAQAYIGLPGTGTLFAGKVNDGSSSTFDIGVTKTGLFAARRLGSANFNRYVAGVSVNTPTATSTSMSNASIWIGAANAVGFSSSQISFAAFGAALTSPQHAALNTIVTQWMSAVGA
jgi:hypothetical protein